MMRKEDAKNSLSVREQHHIVSRLNQCKSRLVFSFFMFFLTLCYYVIVCSSILYFSYLVWTDPISISLLSVSVVSSLGTMCIVAFYIQNRQDVDQGIL